MERQSEQPVLKTTHKKGVLAALARLSSTEESYTTNSLLTLRESSGNNAGQVEIQTDQAEAQTIQELVIPLKTIQTWRPSEQVLTLINLLNATSPQAEILRRSISHNLGYNTPTEHRAIEHYRGVSSFVTHDPNNGTLTIEWGLINPLTNEAKLHSHLRSRIDYKQRVDQGCTVSSGHIATLKSLGELYHVFMFDRLMGPSNFISKDSPIGQTINTLYQNRFVPLTSTGYVQFPAF